MIIDRRSTDPAIVRIDKAGIACCLLIILLALLSGCALVQPIVAETGDRHIIISDALGVADTQAMAEQHCQAAGLHAVYRRNVTRPAVCYDGACQYFECVP